MLCFLHVVVVGIPTRARDDQDVWPRIWSYELLERLAVITILEKMVPNRQTNAITTDVHVRIAITTEQKQLTRQLKVVFTPSEGSWENLSTESE